jgi:ubiquinone/menaquinone biosynthesis C-methylase UbiE
MSQTRDRKSPVREFWNQGSCGEVYAQGSSELEYYESHRAARYRLEPYIRDFAKFPEGRGGDVLEIGVGMGADHVEWAKSDPLSLTGVDLTPRAVEHTQKRLALYGLRSDVQVGDAEQLPFADDSFDIVYSWGVLHHSPNTPQAIQEVRRVLRPNGVARIMIYHKYAIVGYMLWLRYAALAGKPFRSLSDIYANQLESPGTKAYSVSEARQLFRDYSQVDFHTQLSVGDLLEGSAGQRHRGTLLTLAKKLWPRALIKFFLKRHGLFLMIEARK